MGYCAAPNCKNKSTDGIRLFRFPRDKKRQHQWVQNCRRDKWQPTHNSKLCERHFEESQFEQNRADGRKLLKWNAVPTLFNEPNPPESVQCKRNPTTERHLAFQRINKAAVDKAGSSAMVEGEEYYNAGGGEWLEKLDTGQLCRICANPNEYLIPIFEGEGLEHELALKIKKHLPIEVSEADTLPRQVCYQCASTLIAWHDLVICCVEANKKLQELQAEENQDDQTAEAFEAESYDSDTAEGAVENKEDVSVGKEIDKTTKPPTKRTPHLAKEKKSKQKPLVESSCLEKSTEFAESVSKEEKASESVKPNEGASQESSERSHWNSRRFKKRPPWFVPIQIANLRPRKHASSREENIGNQSAIIIKELKNTYKNNSKRSSIGGHVRHTCNICGRKYLTKKSLREHTKKHFQKRVKCDICNKTYRNENVLRTHISLHEGPQPYVCQTCGKGFIFLLSLKQHLKNEHQQKLEYKCEMCNKVLTSEQRLRNHRLTHTKAKVDGESAASHICQKCGKSFKRSASLRVHEQHIHQGIPKQHICEVCGAMFHVGAKLRRHMVKHTGERPFVCEACGMCFSTKHLLKNHQVCHSDARPHQCRVCGKAFKRQRNMRGHEQNMHGLLNTTCQSDSLAAGESNVDYIFPCVVCGKQFSSEQKASVHLRCHSRGRSVMGYPCDICGKVLSSKHGRDNHIRTHTGERPYVCKVCGLALKTSAQLHAHSETHTDKKPFSCNICSKSFRRRPHLEGHLRTHTGEKPFVCDICGRGFSQNGDMKKHKLKLHSGDEPKQCSVPGTIGSAVVH